MPACSKCGRKVAKLGLEDSTGGAGLTYLGGLLSRCLRKGLAFASVLHLFISGSLRELPAGCQYLMVAKSREGRRHDRVRKAPVCAASPFPRLLGCPQFGNGLLLETPGDVVGDNLGLLCPQPDLGPKTVSAGPSSFWVLVRVLWLSSGPPPPPGPTLKIAPSLKGLCSRCSSKPQGFLPPEGVGLPWMVLPA